MLLSDFYSEMKERMERDFNDYLASASLDRLKGITDEANFVDAENLTLAIFPSTVSGETASFTENGMVVSTTMMLYVNDTYGLDEKILTFRYFDAFITWFRENNPLFSQYDTIDNAVLLNMNENADFNGFVIELKSRIYTDMDYS